MKNLSKISLFLFIVCAFGADGDEVKRVKEGDSLTLDIDFRGRFNLIMWKFGFGYQVSVIAETDGNKISYYSEKFRDRLKLNHQTGSLTVNNMRDLDSGHYEVRIEHNSRISYKKFIVTVYVFGADVERVSVMEGDSLTLDIDYREEFDVIKWMFEHSGSIIAETDRNEASYPDDERFRGRLKLNDQTGSLTINNMRITDTGLYHLEIDQNYGLLLKTFSVTVHGVFDEDGVKTVSVMEGDSLTLDTRLREKFSHIKWRFGGSGSIIAEIDSNEISYPFNDTESFRDRLKLNNQTGSLTIKNMRITDTGLYHLEIDHDTWEPYKELKIVVCRFYPDPVHTLGSVTAIVVVVLLVLSGVIYCCKICKRGRQNRESVTDAEKQKTTDSGDYKLQINPCSEGFTGKNANELETSEIPLLSKEDPDRVKPTT